MFLFSAVMLQAQYKYDRVLFRKDNVSIVNQKNVMPFGDQNGDGKADFLFLDCDKRTISLFMGGNQIDTTPAMIWGARYNKKIFSFVSIDVNHDGKEDLLVSYQDSFKNEFEVLGFYGGNQLDTIPDFKLPSPPLATNETWGYRMQKNPDFNGDGYPDLFLMTPNTPSISQLTNGAYYFYSTNPVLDTIPKFIISGDTINPKGPRLNTVDPTFGDVNGDGKTDFWYYTYIPDQFGNMLHVESNLVLGNHDWNPAPSQIIKQDGHNYNLSTMHILGDINGDGKADFSIYQFGNWYPFYYNDYLIYGKFPLDTIPNAGLNTQNQGRGLDILAGDINHDGYQDFLSSYGATYPVTKVWLGGSDMNQHDLPVAYIGGQDNFFGGMYARVGDVNGDGVDDFAIGTTPASLACYPGYFVIISGDTTGLTAINDNAQKEPSFQLDEPYPNPFNPSTTIKYSIAEQGFVSLKIYDMLGAEVMTLVNEYKQHGNYQAVFKPDAFASGVYVIKINVTHNNRLLFQQSKKLSFIK